MTIRTAVRSDVKRLLEIYNYDVLHGTATFDLNPKNIQEWTVWFESHNRDHHPLLTAEIDQEIAGYASLSPYRDKEAYKATAELSVYVDYRYRRMGVARALIDGILTQARREGGLHTVISVITEGNEASVRLHREFGFEYCGTIREAGMKFGKKLSIVHYQIMLS